MDQHLSSKEISGWVLGERSAEAERHARECASCQAELALFGTAMLAFGRSAHHWAAQECGPEAKTIRRIKQAPYHAAANAIGWITLAVALCILAILSAHRGPEPRISPTVADDDTVLFERLDAQLSQTLPSSMQPLTKLVSWQESKSGR